MRCCRSSGNTAASALAIELLNLKAVARLQENCPLPMTSNTQPALFAPPPETSPQVARPSETSVEKPDITERSATPLTIEELLEQIFRSMCSWRRWERELLLGATNTEIARVFGTCYSHGETFNLEFKTDREPALRVLHAIFGTEILTLTAAEVGTYVRHITGIPEPKADHERAKALDALLDQQRIDLRRDMLPYIRSLLGEKLPRKTKNQPAPTPGLSETVTQLLFAPDCLTERSDRCLLVQITRLLTKSGNHKALTAAKHAVSIIDSARGRWHTVISYWLDIDEPTNYRPPTAPL